MKIIFDFFLIAVFFLVLVSPVLAEIVPVNNITNNTSPSPTPTPAMTPQRGLGELVNASSAGMGNLTKNLSIPEAAQLTAPVEIPRKLFWTVVVLFGGLILMGVALDKPGGFAKYRTEFLVVLGGGLVLVGVLFAVI